MRCVGCRCLLLSTGCGYSRRVRSRRVICCEGDRGGDERSRHAFVHAVKSAPLPSRVFMHGHHGLSELRGHGHVLRTPRRAQLRHSIQLCGTPLPRQALPFTAGFNSPRFFCISDAVTQVFVMKVNCNTAHSWVAEKRYSDFLSFDEKLRKKFWYLTRT